MPELTTNFAVSTVATPPSPSTSGTSLVVAAGEGARFPTAPFNATIAPDGVQATPANAEVVRVTAKSTDTLTITRAQESSSARAVVAGDRIWAGVTKKTLSDIESLASGYGFFRLRAAVSVGATTMTIEGLPGVIAGGAGQYILIDVGTTEAEIREITSVSGNTITLERALTYAHAAGDPCYLGALAAQGGLIPWSWWGGLNYVNTSGAATQNVTAFNRLMGPAGQIYNMPHGAFGIFIDGSFWVDNELKPERSFVMAGGSSLTSVITARTGFPFTNTGSVAIIHPYRDNSPVLFESAGPSGRWWFRNFSVDGANLTDSNGIISSPQQPDSTENLRILNCAGKYGMHLADVQYHDMRNVQFDHCAVSLYEWGSGFIRHFNMNITTPSGHAVVMDGVTDSSFYGGLFETIPAASNLIRITNGASRLGFYDIFTSGYQSGSTGDLLYIDSADNPTTACTYVITNMRCNHNSDTINFVNDVQRSLQVNTNTHTQRALPFMWAHMDKYHYIGADGPVSSLGGWHRHGGATGPFELWGANTPEGVYTAPVGSVFHRTNGGAGTCLYIKESGAGNTGWIAK